MRAFYDRHFRALLAARTALVLGLLGLSLTN